MATQEQGPATTPPTKLTVNLIEKAHDALENTAELNGDTKTDTVNRALQVYAWLEKEQATGAVFYVGLRRRGLMRLLAKRGLAAPERLKRVTWN